MGWIGVDLDRTLARYEHGDNLLTVGEPITPVLERVRAALAAGRDVRILTARACAPDPGDFPARQPTAAPSVDYAQVDLVRRWCREHLGQPLRVQFWKDYAMDELWDDRAVPVEPNTGRFLLEPEPVEPEPAATAEQLAAAAEAHADAVLADLQPVVTLVGGYLAETEHALKPVTALEGKLQRYDAEGKGPADLYDALRYTAVFPTDTYAADAARLQRALSTRGYRVLRSRDFWANGDGTYLGVNLVLATPDGYAFELQLHTPESLQANSAQDRFYRQLRAGDLDAATEAFVRGAMRRGLESVPRPPALTAVEKLALAAGA